mmetsp:Transcript_21346/g.66154  ORF Transcript_21346/g.66154 Transcript_21346/m.66154 type:complete len:799 (+) Transcript_21346:46-2442(+)
MAEVQPLLQPKRTSVLEDIEGGKPQGEVAKGPTYHVISSMQRGADRGALLGVDDVWLTLYKSSDKTRLTTGGYAPLGFRCDDYIQESVIDKKASKSIEEERKNIEKVGPINNDVKDMIKKFGIKEYEDKEHKVKFSKKDKANVDDLDTRDVLVAFRSTEHGKGAGTEQTVNYAVFGQYSYVMQSKDKEDAGGALQCVSDAERAGWPDSFVTQVVEQGIVEFKRGEKYMVMEQFTNKGKGTPADEAELKQARMKQKWSQKEAKRSAIIFTLLPEDKQDDYYTTRLVQFLRANTEEGRDGLQVMASGTTEATLAGAEDRVRYIMSEAFFVVLEYPLEPWQLGGGAKGDPEKAADNMKVRGWDLADHDLRTKLNRAILKGTGSKKPGARFFVSWVEAVDASMNILRRRMLLILFFNILLMGIGIGFTLCDKNGTHAAPPYFWLPIAFVGGILHLYDEILIVQRSGIPFIQEVTHFRTLSQKLGFGPWFAFGLFNSLMDYLGTVSYTIVTATWVSRMGACMQTDSLTDSLWVEDFSHSMFSKLFGIVPLGLFAVFVWGATFVRLVHMLVSYWPWSMEAPNGDVKRAKYFNVLGTRVDRVEYFQFIAEQAGMDTVAQTVVEYRKARAVANIRKIERELADDPRVQGEWPFVLGDVFICMFHITMRNVLNKLVKCISTGLQITLLSIELASIHNTQYIGPLLSIIFAMLAFGPAYISVIELEVLLCKKIWPLAHQADFTEQGETKMRGLLDKNGRDLRKVIYLFRGAWLTFALFGLFLALKLVMTFWCSSNLWNLDFPLSDGCV